MDSWNINICNSLLFTFILNQMVLSNYYYNNLIIFTILFPRYFFFFFYLNLLFFIWRFLKSQKKEGSECLDPILFNIVMLFMSVNINSSMSTSFGKSLFFGLFWHILDQVLLIIHANCEIENGSYLFSYLLWM